jgi:hypothetical protein
MTQEPGKKEAKKKYNTYELSVFKLKTLTEALVTSSSLAFKVSLLVVSLTLTL